MSGGIFQEPDLSRTRPAILDPHGEMTVAETIAAAHEQGGWREDGNMVDPAGPDAVAGMVRESDRYSRLAAASYRQINLGNSSVAVGVAREESYDQIIAGVKSLSGVVLENPSRGGYGAQAQQDVDEGRLARDTRFLEVAVPERREEIFAQKLDELAGQRPELAERIAALRELYGPGAIAKRAEQDADAAWDATPNKVGAVGAMLAGTLAGTARDPIQALGLLASGGTSGAATVAGRILGSMAREAAANAAAAAVAEPFTQYARAQLGLDTGLQQAAVNIGFGALLGAGFGGLFGAGRELLRPLPAVERGVLFHAAAAELSDQVARADAPPTAVSGFAGGRAYEQAVEYVQSAQAPPPELVFEFGEPEPKRQRVTREELPARPGETATVDDKPVRFERFRPSDLETDANAFQYKGGGDAAGVTERLRSVSRWDPVASGKVLVFEAEDGTRFVADGHQRLGLAKRLAGIEDRVPPGMTRFYHGGFPSSDHIPLWVSSNRKYAEGWADKGSAGKQLWQIDVPSDHPLIQPDYPDQGIAQGFTKNLELPADLASNRRIVGDDTVRLDGFLFRERDGWTRGDVRALAAKKNMQEGSGDALDAARVLRDRPDLADGSLPTTAPMMRQAIALSKLSDEAWGMTLNGLVPPSYAAAVGGTVADPLQHAAVLALLREAQPETERAARLLIGEAMEAGFTVEKQIDLFGAADATRSLMAERVAVLDAALSALRQDKRLFGVLARQADAIEAGGNVLARATNEARALNAGGLEDILVKLARRAGPISDALNVQAARVADGTARTTASRAFLDQLQAVVEQRGLIGLLKDAPELRPAAVVEPGSPEAARIGETARATEKPAEAAPEAAVARETAAVPRTVQEFKLVRGGLYDPEAPPKRPGQLDRRVYNIMRDGEQIGTVVMKVDRETAEIRAINSEAPEAFGYRPLSNSLGPRAMATLLRQFLEENPQITRLTGERVSGARRGGDYYNLAGSGVQVDIPIPERWRTPRQPPVHEPVRPLETVMRSPELDAAYDAVQAMPDGPQREAGVAAYLSDWDTAVEANSIGGITSGPNEGSNTARQTPSAMTPPEKATDAASTDVQSASGSSLANALADDTSSTAGRQSQLMNRMAEPSAAPASLHEAVPLGTREDGGDARMLTREAALVEADRAELYADLVVACRG